MLDYQRQFLEMALTRQALRFGQFTLKSGRVEITETNRKGKSTLVRIVEPGQMFGYLCFCPHRNEPRGTEARAITSSVAYRAGYKNFKAVLRKDPSAASRLVESARERAKARRNS